MTIKINRNTVYFLFLIASLFFLWYWGRLVHFDTGAIEASLKKLPIFYAGIIFVVLYVVVTFFVWLSKDAFKFIAAVLFGAYMSTLFVYLAEIINAVILFGLSRHLGRGFVEKHLQAKYNNLDKKLGSINFFWLFLFRVVPLFPFRFLDLACGLTRISFKRYFLAVILGSPLRIFWVQYVLSGVGKSIFHNPYALSEYLLQNKPLFIFSFAYLILAILVAFKVKRKEKSSCL
ncbi:MAG: VTT domain-containing protein [Candidatus Omnitrophica bacterium]|nr:VTT domain-containing protein [Candidatus Omnitrophota bacterium]